MHTGIGGSDANRIELSSPPTLPESLGMPSVLLFALKIPSRYSTSAIGWRLDNSGSGTHPVLNKWYPMIGAEQRSIWRPGTSRLTPDHVPDGCSTDL